MCSLAERSPSVSNSMDEICGPRWSDQIRLDEVWRRIGSQRVGPSGYPTVAIEPDSLTEGRLSQPVNERRPHAHRAVASIVVLSAAFVRCPMHSGPNDRRQGWPVPTALGDRRSGLTPGFDGELTHRRPCLCPLLSLGMCSPRATNVGQGFTNRIRE
jgi:hypothetical protein